VAAVLIEALTKTDYRAFIREQVIESLGLGDELFVGLPDARHERAADMHEPAASGAGQVKRAEENNPEFRRAGTPGGGGYASARAMAAFYQMLAAGGTLNGKRLLSPRMDHRRHKAHTRTPPSPPDRADKPGPRRLVPVAA
jgi:CubicO group peptidase (beta-lactamase class C family)